MPTARDTYLHKDALRVWTCYAMHAIKNELEVRAVQECLERSKVIDLLQEVQVVLHWINDLCDAAYETLMYLLNVQSKPKSYFEMGASSRRMQVPR